MSLVYVKNKKTGSTYVYEQEPHYDPTTKQSRPKRTYLGVLDEVTGEIKRLGRGKNKNCKNNSNDLQDQETLDQSTQEAQIEINDLKQLLKEKEEIIRNQKQEISKLEKLLASTLAKLRILNRP